MSITDNKEIIQNRNLHVAIIIRRNCNMRCAYCSPLGENKFSKGDICKDLSMDEIKEIIDLGIESGFNIFRLSGGEPTLHPEFDKIVKYILNKNNDTKIIINTNGFKLKQYIDLIKDNKDRIEIRLSLDSTDLSHKSQGIGKILTPEIQDIINDLIKSNIKLRLNSVITKTNISEVDKLIEIARKLGTHIKFFDLYLEEDFIGNKNDAFKWWKNNHISLSNFVASLEKQSGKSGYLSYSNSRCGISAMTFDLGNIKVFLQDSNNGANYNPKYCYDCKYFGNLCRVGFYSPIVTSAMVIQPTGCRVKQFQRSLKGKTHDEQLKSFDNVINIFKNIELIIPSKKNQV